MKDDNRTKLLEELIMEGSSNNEAEELLRFAFELSNLQSLRRSYEFKKSVVQKIAKETAKKRFIFGFPKILIPALAVLILIISFTAVANAQKSLPGDALYPIKRLSENVAASVNPKFKKEILQRRIEEIKGLREKGDHKSIRKMIKDNEDEIKKIEQKKEEEIKREEENKNNEKKEDELKKDVKKEIKGVENQKIEEINKNRKEAKKEENDNSDIKNDNLLKKDEVYDKKDNEEKEDKNK